MMEIAAHTLRARRITIHIYISLTTSTTTTVSSNILSDSALSKDLTNYATSRARDPEIPSAYKIFP